MRRLTEIAQEVYQVDKSHITVTIRGYPPEDVGVGRKLICDIKAKR